MPQLFNYNRFKDLAKRLVDKYTPDGNNGVWHKNEIVTPDEDKPWETTSELKKFEFRMVMIGTRDRLEEFHLTEVLNDNELQFDGTFAITYPQGFEPRTDEMVTTTAGDTFTCKFVSKYAPERDTLAYVVGLR